MWKTYIYFYFISFQNSLMFKLFSYILDENIISSFFNFIKLFYFYLCLTKKCWKFLVGSSAFPRKIIQTLPLFNVRRSQTLRTLFIYNRICKTNCLWKPPRPLTADKSGYARCVRILPEEDELKARQSRWKYHCITCRINLKILN